MNPVRTSVMTIAQQARRLANGVSHRYRAFRKDRGGMAAIEFAIVFPMMLVLYFGIVDVTNLLTVSRKVTLASSTIGDLVAQAPGSVLLADLNGLNNAIAPILAPIPPSTIKTDVYVYRKNGNAYALRWHYNVNGTCPGTLPANMLSMMADNNDLVVARVCTSVYPITGKVIGSGARQLKDQFILRPREAPTITCSNCSTT